MMNDTTAPFELTCLICGKTISLIEADLFAQDLTDRSFLPNGAMELCSYGHYGTTFFDPCDGTQVAALICDECMEEHSNRLLYIDKQRYLKPYNAAMRELEEQRKVKQDEREVAPAPHLPTEEPQVDEDGYPIISEELPRATSSEKPLADN
ncbi:hypothetical protein [Bifidobacterium miconisargentati]|uniref:hypothetical protein n=1 Tax=Bifidobacterium miconisargentati TaxID=2834437 RepID=UPI001BDBDC14|nr:hypothetical protein [Bifidobacterium miconisargentati]MBW3090723.1 hypothetical protein [Bifidobacterium miconisargentati]